MLRHVMAFIVLTLLALPMSVPMTAMAQEQAATADRSATGGAQTLDDILARQRGETLDDSFRSENIGGGAVSAPGLGPLGGASDPELWRALRYNKADVRVSTRNETGKVLVQDGGMWWYQVRQGPLATYGGWLLLGTLGALILFYILRGKIGIDEPMTGRTVTRFKAFERFSHWLLAGSFILLGLTGLLVLFGRMFIAPLLGKEVNATLLVASKFIHNNVSWAFMLGLVFVFLLWVWHNIPDKTDLKWFAQFGGIIGKNHPPAKKFNGGQKIIFWSVIVFGTAISVTGLSMLFPYQLPFMATVLDLVNSVAGTGFPTQLAPQEEMQYAQLLHALAAFVLMAIIIAHIYIGSVGMEGASAAMTTGEVDEAWAHQHHSIWLDEVLEAEGRDPHQVKPQGTPAE
ncbi:MAG: formate dehydrogenase subunit gamma [Pelagimonas sp.]|jgi:formate dehydrogenase subunit gamma|nr:formate dehydrogenase subunit gamma [Pelagimonas sp.]